MNKTTLPSPPRRGTPEPAAFTAEKSAESVAVNVRISPDRARYLRMLSAASGEKQRELVEQAIDHLRERRGEV